jgi:hypothetical protein
VGFATTEFVYSQYAHESDSGTAICPRPTSLMAAIKLSAAISSKRSRQVGQHYWLRGIEGTPTWPIPPRLRHMSYALILSGVLIFGMVAPVRAAGPSQDELDQSAAATLTWLMTNKSYDGQRYVELDQINAKNVAGLNEVCTYDTGTQAPAQSSPVVYERRIFLSAGQTTAAIDAASCKEIWRHVVCRNGGNQHVQRLIQSYCAAAVSNKGLIRK